MYHAERSLYYSGKPPEGMFLRMVDDRARLNQAVKPALRSMCSDKVIIDIHIRKDAEDANVYYSANEE